MIAILFLVWEEVFENDGNLTARSIVHVWKGGWQKTMHDVSFVISLKLLHFPDHIPIYRPPRQDTKFCSPRLGT